MSDSKITNINDDKDNKPGPSRRVSTIAPQSENTLNDGSTESEDKKIRSKIDCRYTVHSSSSSSSESIMSDTVEYDTDYEEIDVSESNDGDEETVASSRTEAEPVNAVDSEALRETLEAHHESVTIIRNIKKSTKVRPHGRDAIPRLQHELREIEKNPPPNCTAEMGDNLFHWTATIVGPAGTVYQGGTFSLDIRFPHTYPFRPPRIRFITRIYHCNIDARGLICLDILNEKWSPVLTISKVLLSIWLLLCECNADDPLVMAIAEQYVLRRVEHDKTARLWVKKYAMQTSEVTNVKKEKTEMPAVQSQTEANQTSEPQQTARTSASGNISTEKSNGEANGKKEHK